jgi:hypothetical protein
MSEIESVEVSIETVEERKSKNKSVRRSLQDMANGVAIQRYDWMDLARCKGRTEDMFPKGHKDISYIQGAREMCAYCTVRPQCLEYALEFPPADMHGVWAGMTSRQLAAEQRRRGVAPTKPTLSQMWND